AIQVSRVHATLLREELDTEPNAEVTALAERLRSEPPAQAIPETAPVPPIPPLPKNAAVPPPAKPVRRTRVYASMAAAVVFVLTMVAVYGMRRPGSSPVAAARSVAVLPFLNMSQEPDNAYFSDGLSEQIIAALSRIDGLRVAARTSSFALRD